MVKPRKAGSPATCRVGDFSPEKLKGLGRLGDCGKCGTGLSLTVGNVNGNEPMRVVYSRPHLCPICIKDEK